MALKQWSSHALRGFIWVTSTQTWKCYSCVTLDPLLLIQHLPRTLLSGTQKFDTSTTGNEQPACWPGAFDCNHV